MTGLMCLLSSTLLADDRQSAVANQPATADPASINNGTDWRDTKGNLVAAHEGEAGGIVLR